MVVRLGRIACAGLGLVAVLGLAGCVQTSGAGCVALELTGAEVKAAEAKVVAALTKYHGAELAKNSLSNTVLVKAVRCGGDVTLEYDLDDTGYPKFPKDGGMIVLVGGGSRYTVNTRTGRIIQWRTEE